MVVVAEGGLFGPFVAENTTMIVIGLILSVFGVGFLCWLLFTLVAGQASFAAVKSPVLRVVIAILFAAPAAIAGYHATLALAHIGVPSASWQEVFAIVGAIVAGGTAFVRLAARAAPPAAGHVGAVAPGQSRVMAVTRHG